MRLIDADALKAQTTKKNHIWDYITDANGRGLTEIIDSLPPIDAVPVVRCKDCRWGKEVCGNIECSVDLNYPSEYHGYDWFCPNGERRADGTEK